jgi:hypothetical protein
MFFVPLAFLREGFLLYPPTLPFLFINMAKVNLSDFGQDKSGFVSFGGNAAETELSKVEGILETYALAFIEEAQKNINNKGLTSKGNMSDLVFNIEQTKSGYTISVGYDQNNPASKYYDFQNKGVAGVGKTIASPYSFKSIYPSRKMVTEILLWLRTAKNASRFEDQKKGLSALQTKRKTLGEAVDQSKRLSSTAYAIATGIKKAGIKQSLFFDDAISKTFGKDFINKVSEALGADVTLKIVNYGDNN